MLKKIALVTFLITIVGVLLVSIDDYLKPSSDFKGHVPGFIYLTTWIVGLIGIIINIVYSIKKKTFIITGILGVSFFPWIFPIAFLSYYGFIAVLLYLIAGLLLHFTTFNIKQNN